MIEELLNCLANNGNEDKFVGLLEELFELEDHPPYMDKLVNAISTGGSIYKAIEESSLDRVTFLTDIGLLGSEISDVELKHNLSTDTTLISVGTNNYELLLVTPLMLNSSLTTMFEMIKDGAVTTKELFSYIVDGILLPIDYSEFDYEDDQLNESTEENIDETTQVSDIPVNDAEIQINVLKSDKDGYRKTKINESVLKPKDVIYDVVNAYNQAPVLGVVVDYNKESGIAYLKDTGLVSKLNDEYLAKFIRDTVLSGMSSDGKDATELPKQSSSGNKAYFKTFDAARKFLQNNKVNSKIYGCEEGFYIIVD